MRKFKRSIAAVTVAVASMLPTQAAYGTNITDIADDASALFTTVSVVAVTIVAFKIGLWVVRKIRS